MSKSDQYINKPNLQRIPSSSIPERWTHVENSLIPISIVQNAYTTHYTREYAHSLTWKGKKRRKNWQRLIIHDPTDYIDRTNCINPQLIDIPNILIELLLIEIVYGSGSISISLSISLSRFSPFFHSYNSPSTLQTLAIIIIIFLWTTCYKIFMSSSIHSNSNWSVSDKIETPIHWPSHNLFSLENEPNTNVQHTVCPVCS